MALASEYAALLVELSKSAETAKVEEEFLALLERRGHLKLLPSIVTAYERLIAKEKSVSEPVLTIARESDRQGALAAAKVEMGGAVSPRVEIDAKQVGGWRLQNGSTLIDRTEKRMLLDLYRKMTA